MKSLKMIVGICALLIIMMFIAGCTGSDDDDSEKDMQLKITVLKAEKKTEGWIGLEALEGNYYLHLKIKIENLNKNEVYELTNMCFDVETEEGEYYSVWFQNDEEPDYIGKGETKIYYCDCEIPEDDVGKTLNCYDIDPDFDEEIDIPSY